MITFILVAAIVYYLIGGKKSPFRWFMSTRMHNNQDKWFKNIAGGRQINGRSDFGCRTLVVFKGAVFFLGCSAPPTGPCRSILASPSPGTPQVGFPCGLLGFPFCLAAHRVRIQYHTISYLHDNHSMIS